MKRKPDRPRRPEKPPTARADKPLFSPITKNACFAETSTTLSPTNAQRLAHNGCCTRASSSAVRILAEPSKHRKTRARLPRSRKVRRWNWCSAIAPIQGRIRSINKPPRHIQPQFPANQNQLPNPFFRRQSCSDPSREQRCPPAPSHRRTLNRPPPWNSVGQMET